MNQLNIIGNLGGDPKLNDVNGTACCEFSVATSEKWKDKNGNMQQHTEWHSVKAWGKLADLCSKYLAKGRKVRVTGKLRTRTWDDPDGDKRFKTECIAQDVEFLSSKSDTADQGDDQGIPF